MVTVTLWCVPNRLGLAWLSVSLTRIPSCWVSQGKRSIASAQFMGVMMMKAA